MGGKIEKYIGQTYAYLTITGIDRERMNQEKEIRGASNTYVFADCSCGIKHQSYNLNKIKRGKTKSCGHLTQKHDHPTKTNKVEFYNDYGIIYTLDGTPFYFDKEDYHYLKNKFWYNRAGYLTHCYVENGKNHYILFHRLIINIDKTQIIDHIDRDTHNNRKSNLRICTHQENDRNKNISPLNTSGITGVFLDKSRNKWYASITVNNKTIYLGRFKNFIDAIKERLKAEIKYFKDFAPQRYLYTQYFSDEELQTLLSES